MIHVGCRVLRVIDDCVAQAQVVHGKVYSESRVGEEVQRVALGRGFAGPEDARLARLDDVRSAATHRSLAATAMGRLSTRAASPALVNCVSPVARPAWPEIVSSGGAPHASSLRVAGLTLRATSMKQRESCRSVGTNQPVSPLENTLSACLIERRRQF